MHTPLDAPSEFIPSEDERPAGEYMATYWAEIAPWAKRFSFVIFAYFAWVTYLQYSIYSSGQAVYQSFLLHLSVLAVHAPTLALGYFCFQFGHLLEAALVGQNQLLLEKAFQQLHRILITALVISALCIWSFIGSWYSTLKIISESNTRLEYLETPLESEEE